MLRSYTPDGERLIEGEAALSSAVWHDLLNPSAEEDKIVEQLLGISIPSREEMEEIELSARLYGEDGATFMTMTALAGLDTELPSKTPVTFILKGQVLVSVRYAEPKPFTAYVTRTQRAGAPCGSGEQVMLGLIEAIVDRTADALERIGNDIDNLSREVFQKGPAKADKKTRDLQSVINRIGAKAELLTMIQESLVSMSRLVAYHTARKSPVRKGGEEGHLAKLIQRDAQSLGSHAQALNGRLDFLLDATLGLINLEQNQIIKIFSVAAVVFLPPTLVASIYGMNYDFMPELHWGLGYPWALGLMVLSAALPFLYFKRQGWL